MTIELANLDALLAEQRSERAPEWSDDRFFEYFVLEQLLKNSGASTEDLVDAIVDGGNDCGVDAMICLINDIPAAQYYDLTTDVPNGCKVDLVILQGKTSSSFQERPLLEMAVRLPKLLDPQRADDEVSVWCNPALLQKTRNYLDAQPLLLPRFPHTTLKVYYATRGSAVQPKVRQAGDELVAAVQNRNMFKEASVNFLGATDILECARQQYRTTFSLSCATQPMASPDGGGYVSLVTLPAYKQFVSSGDGSLNTQHFESNVRDHEGPNEVNLAIRGTLATASQDDFWWLNNGVTIVANNVMANGHSLVLENPQVVNGLQTSTEVWLGELAQNDRRLVLCRVIKAQESGVRDRIVQATNYQTAIPKSALRATDKRQRDLEDWFLRVGLYYDRRRNYYSNRVNAPIDKIISMTTLAEAVAACLLQEPFMSRARGNTLMSVDSHYDRIFACDDPRMYLNCLRLIEIARHAVRYCSNINTYYEEDWIHLVACASTILLTRRQSPKPDDIAELQLDDVDPNRVGDLVPLVARHLSKSRLSTLPLKKQAESPEVTKAVITSARVLLHKSTWNEWPRREVTDDFLSPASRLHPDRRL